MSFRLVDCRDDVRVRGAATDIAAHVLTNLGIVIRVPFGYASHRRHNLAGRAVSALKGIVIDESLLHRMQNPFIRSQTFDRGYAPITGTGCKGKTREYANTVKMNGARTALSMIAAFLRSGQADVFAQRIEQCSSGVNRHAPLGAVNVDG